MLTKKADQLAHLMHHCVRGGGGGGGVGVGVGVGVGSGGGGGDVGGSLARQSPVRFVWVMYGDPFDEGDDGPAQEVGTSGL